MTIRNLDELTLRDLYINQKLSAKGIAKLIECSDGVINRQLRGYGIPVRTSREAAIIAMASNCRGGKYYQRGYVMAFAPNHPYMNRNRHVYEHRLVMEQKLGRYLEPRERVHHIDGIKDHNTDDNLELCTAPNHTTITAYCAACMLRNSVAEQDKRISEQDKRVRLLEWQIKQLNQLVYGKDEPTIEDILRRGIE